MCIFNVWVLHQNAYLLGIRPKAASLVMISIFNLVAAANAAHNDPEMILEKPKTFEHCPTITVIDRKPKPYVAIRHAGDPLDPASAGSNASV